MTTNMMNNRPKRLILFLSFKETSFPKHLGLYSIVPSQNQFDRLTSYHYQCIRLTCHGLSHAATVHFLKTFENLKLVFKYRRFSAEDHIFSFGFLTKLMEEADTVENSKVQLMILLCYLLTGNVGDQYRETSNWSRPGTLVEYSIGQKSCSNYCISELPSRLPLRNSTN